MFGLGQVYLTPGAQVRTAFENASAGAVEKASALLQNDHCPWEFLSRHVRGDWGELTEGDRQANIEAVIEGGRLLSSYRLKDGTPLWVISEAENDNHQREATTLLLKSEY